MRAHCRAGNAVVQDRLCDAEPRIS
jgi:hypothetical protein